MLRFTFLLAFCFLGVVSVGCARRAESTAPAAPRLRHSDAVDAGEFGLNSSVQLSFEVHNDGTAPLIIGHIATDCQCKAVYIKDSKIAVKDLSILPGEGVNLALDLMITGRIRVPQTTALQIHSNDPAQPVSPLTIAYTPTARLYTVPTEIVMDDVPARSMPLLKVDLFADDGAPLVATDTLTTNSPDSFSVLFVPGAADATQALANSYARRIGHLEIKTTRPLTTESTFTHTLAIKRGEVTLLALPITIRFQREYTLSPSTIALPRRSGGTASYDYSVRCSRADERPFTLTAQCPDPNIVVRITPPVGDDHANVIHVTYSKGTSPAVPITTKVVLKCASADGKLTELDIPVRVAPFAN